MVFSHAQRLPDLSAIVVVLKDSEVETILGQVKMVDNIVKRPFAGLALGIAAKGKVAQHLEEGEMATVQANGVDVVGAQALLARSGADALLQGLGAQIVLLELVHAGVGQKQRRVIGHQRRRRELLAAVLFKKVQERRANLGSGHSGKVRGRQEILLIGLPGTLPKAALLGTDSFILIQSRLLGSARASIATASPFS